MKETQFDPELLKVFVEKVIKTKIAEEQMIRSSKRT